ncbi:MAG TPA: hypothetical protein VF613_19560 [Longimicrobium sp.]|jgi:hypothetical protein
MKPHCVTALLVLLLAGCRDSTSPDSDGFWKDVSASANQACGLARTGEVYCWGEGYGLVPRTPVSGLTATALVENQCARNAAGEVHCWGGSIGTTPVQLAAAEARSFSRGYAVTCVVGADGVARCAGDNTHGELGNGTSGGRRESMAPVSGGYRFASVVAKGWTICGIDTGGAAACWGWNYMATLGRRTAEACPPGPFSDPCATTPGPVSGGLSFRAIDVGGGHACGIATDGRLYCWGSASFDVLGTGAAPDRCTANDSPCTYTPVPAGTRTDFRSIHTSGVFSCGLTADAEAYCWGSNYYGQLGDGVSNASGTGPSRREAGLVSGGHRFTRIALGDDHGCGVTRQGKIFCWGKNEAGQLGVGQKPNSNRPVEVLRPS